MAKPTSLSRVTVRDSVDEYLTALRRRVAREELSPATVTAYERDLDEFVGLVGADTVLDDIESDDIDTALTRVAAAADRRYTRSAKIGVDGGAQAGRGPHSRARWFGSVRGLFRWAAERGYVQLDPMAGMRTPRTPKRATGARLGIGVAETRALRTAAGGAPVGRARRTAQQNLTLRDTAILRLLSESGPRVSEVCGANRADLRIHEDTGRPVLRVKGKGRKVRDVPLSSGTRAAIDAYLEQERPAPPVASDPNDPRERTRVADARRALFVTVRGYRMSARDVERMVERLALSVLGARVTPHGLRHTALTILVRSGTDIATVSQVAGHESVATTSVYLDESMVAAADAIDRSPLADE
jgi:integrase/recombinase XerD